MSAGIAAFGMMTASGATVPETAETLFRGALPKLKPHTLGTTATCVPVAAVTVPLPAIPESLSRFRCRNNQIAFGLLQQIGYTVETMISRFGAPRVAVVVGSSTSGLDATERAFSSVREKGVLPADFSFAHQHAMGSLSQFIAAVAGVTGPAYTVSTACASSSRAMLCAAGLLRAGLADAVITGGVDTLCDLTVNGFFSLGSLSDAHMNPMSANRKGLNIGEGGALFVLTREEQPLTLMGGGESMDAYHMSAPDPEGRGARLAMERALKDSGLRATDIAYVNLHGTATRANDAMESLAVHSLFGEIQASSTKPFTGHCLGAAGAIEAAICCLSVPGAENFAPPHIYDQAYDTTLPRLPLAACGESLRGQYLLSNSFAFGGSNCALIIRRPGGGT